MKTSDADHNIRPDKQALTAILTSLPEDLPPQLRKLFDLDQKSQDGLPPPRLYQDAVEQISVAISITDRNAKILYVNAAFEALTGYRAGEVRGRKESVLSDLRTPRAVYVEMWETIGKGDVWHMEDCSGKGHHTRVISDEDFEAVIVQYA